MATATASRNLVVRGGPFTLEKLLASGRGPEDDERRRLVFDKVDVEGVVFEGAINFDGAEFGPATFRGVTFKGPVGFKGACFHESVRFDSVTFEGTVSFKEAVFEGEAIFEHSDEDEADPEWPEEVTFKRWADFRQARFVGRAKFGGAQFERRARFNGAHFGAGAGFKGAVFMRARTFGEVTVKGELDLDRVSFEAPVRIRAGADSISCKGAQFQSLTTIDLWGGEISLDEAEFAQPSRVAGRVSDPKPRVASLERANVAHLTLADLDLCDCRFVGVHNLDGLGFEGGIDLREVETNRKTSRRVIADEAALGSRPHGKRDSPAAVAHRANAERIARAYRALRKGREDNKDAPGAADFYYGEMEMRKRAASGFDRALLPAYWLVSGYGLRAWRALAALALTVLVFAAGFALWGFNPNQNFGQSLLFSTESTTSLFRAPAPPDGAHLTDAGHGLQMGLRLLGPLFFGLAILSLRGRVKR